MLVMIYFCKWDGSVSSHDLLRQAVKEYLRAGAAAASRSASDPAMDPELEPAMDPELEPAMDPELEPAIDSELEPAMDPELEPAMDPGINSVIDSVQDWEIAEREGGKPYFPEHPEIHFSISHSGDYWACAIAPKEVGLDLQEENVTARAEKLAKRFFHPHEQAYLKSVDYRDFTRIWAAKESYLKYTGDGIAGGMEHFSVADPVTIDAVQTEIPFEENYKLILTGAFCPEFRTEDLQK